MENIRKEIEMREREKEFEYWTPLFIKVFHEKIIVRNDDIDFIDPVYNRPMGTSKKTRIFSKLIEQGRIKKLEKVNAKDKVSYTLIPNNEEEEMIVKKYEKKVEEKNKQKKEFENNRAKALIELLRYFETNSINTFSRRQFNRLWDDFPMIVRNTFKTAEDLFWELKLTNAIEEKENNLTMKKAFHFLFSFRYEPHLDNEWKVTYNKFSMYRCHFYL